MNKVLIVIPALNPPLKLIEYVEELIEKEFETILIIDDGSRKEFYPIFKKLAEKKECVVLRNAINLGKGRSLKNSINYFLNLPNLDEYMGIITVDSDGQHEVLDVLKVEAELAKGKEELVLGSRNFNEENVPPKSSFGNKMTTALFKLLYGKKIEDTQTGLRGIPTSLASSFIDLKGERFQYEMNMLVSAVRHGVEVKEVGIRTVYFDNNSETHFRPLKDSYEILGILLGTFFKYSLSSLSSFLIDIALFQSVIFVLSGFESGKRILIATVIARLFSSLFNFVINKIFVFGSTLSSRITIVKYYGLVLVQMLLSALLVSLFYRVFAIPETVIKIIIDMFLFILSYRIQKLYIFR